MENHNTPPKPEQSDHHRPPVTVSSDDNKTSTMAILGLVFAFVFTPLGLVFSILGLREVKNKPGMKGHGLAMAGLIISIIGIVIGLVLIPLAIIAYFGVFDPGKLLPDDCTMYGTITCEGAYVSGSSTDITLESKMSNSITVDKLKVTSMSNAEFECTPKNFVMESGDSTSFSCPIPLTKGEASRFILELEYITSDTGMERTTSGDLRITG